ncbi:hypothetical protein TGRUB_430530, partial [Toxoplasma gondii RUB]
KRQVLLRILLTVFAASYAQPLSSRWQTTVLKTIRFPSLCLFSFSVCSPRPGCVLSHEWESLEMVPVPSLYEFLSFHRLSRDTEEYQTPTCLADLDRERHGNLRLLEQTLMPHDDSVISVATGTSGAGRLFPFPNLEKLEFEERLEQQQETEKLKRPRLRKRSVVQVTPDGSIWEGNDAALWKRLKQSYGYKKTDTRCLDERVAACMHVDVHAYRSMSTIKLDTYKNSLVHVAIPLVRYANTLHP